MLPELVGEIGRRMFLEGIGAVGARAALPRNRGGGGGEGGEKSGSIVTIVLPDSIRKEGKDPAAEAFGRVGLPFWVQRTEAVVGAERWRGQPIGELPLGFDATVIGLVSERESSKSASGIRLRTITVGGGTARIDFGCASNMGLYLPVAGGEGDRLAGPEEFIKQLVGGRRVCRLVATQHGIVTEIRQTRALQIRWGDMLKDLAKKTGVERNSLEAMNRIENPDRIYAGNLLYTSLSRPTAG